MLKIIKKILSILLLAVVFISNAGGLIKAAYEFTESYIVEIGEAPYHLKYYNESKGMYTYSICAIVGHYENGTFYPAYCLNRDLKGVGKVESYTVDVDSVITDNKIWRAVKNGYPYKSAQEMGLNSEFDAFAVTKFAVYCLTGQADVNLYIADEGDEEGQAMLRALHSLVDIGINGGDSFKDELKITKIGEFVEDGEYYSLTYKVNSGSTISNYKIKSVTGIQDGDLITDVNGNIKTEFKSGENFKIKILKAHLDSDKDINIEVDASLKSYPMFYGKTRISGTQNYLLTASSYQNVTASVSTNLKLNNAKIKINKVDSESKTAIEDTVFELYNSKNELIETNTTDSNGVVEFSNLYQGEYLIKEKQANEKYEESQNKEEKVNVSYNKTVEKTIENKPKKGNLIINKVDKDNNQIALGNVEFELYDENKKLVGKFSTDNNGKIEIEGLRIGKYLLKETSTNQWYNLAEDTEIEVKWNATSEKTIENELKKSQIKIIKVDKDNNKVKIPGVVFEVQDVEGNVLEQITTDEEGVAYTKKYPKRDYQKLRLHEIRTDEMYVLDDEIKEIELEENKITEVTFENEKIKGEIEVIKKTAEDSIVTGIKKGEPLEGVQFDIYDVNNKIVETITTNKDGIAKTKKLEKGTYRVKEKSTDEWYFLDENYYTVNIEKNNEVYFLNLENIPKTPEEEVIKTGPELAKADEEIEYRINVKNVGNVELNNFIWEDNLPTDYIRVTKINLGTFNQQNTYNLYYKTNFTDDYVLFMEDISTTQNEEIDFSKELADNEYITNIKLDFGTVDVGFQSENDASIFAKVNSKVKRDDIFENKVTLTSNYNGQYLVKDSSWKTKIFKILPVTGM